jgi:cell division protein FtsW (lipid II flippase)
MVVLAVTCGIATFYESSHGTAAAQRDFYQTRWFTALLSLLAVNIFLSMLKRYPWSRHQAGFVMAHVGIVLLLAARSSPAPRSSTGRSPSTKATAPAR